MTYFHIFQNLLGFSIFLQTYELLRLHPELPRGALGDGVFGQWLLRLRAAVALLFLINPTPAACLYLLGSQVLINFRLGGAVAGGSDSLTLWSLITAALAGHFGPESKLGFGALLFLVVQVCMSYVFAGGRRLFSRAWRRGDALRAVLCSKQFSVPSAWAKKEIPKNVAALASWIVILWELLFPLALFHQELRWVFLIIGVVFHFNNFYFFGLNRFFWSWVATYPIVLLVFEGAIS